MSEPGKLVDVKTLNAKDRPMLNKNVLILTSIRLLLLTLLVFLHGRGASQSIEWQRTIGGAASDYLTTTDRTDDGGYILAGDSNSHLSGEKTEDCSGVYDIWVVKLDAARNIEWQKTIGGEGAEFRPEIQQTADRGYILACQSDSNISGEKTENSRGNYDYWVVKLDTSGNIQWQKTIGGDAVDIVYHVEQTRDDGFILGGYSSSNISGDKTENVRGSLDYWLVKLDALGGIQWQKTIGGTYGETDACINQTTDGGYILGGSSSSNMSGDKTENSRGGIDYWIIKLDSVGNIQWQRTIGGRSNEHMAHVEQTADGGYVLGGGSLSNISGEKTENCRGHYDYWIVKLDSSGNIQWQKTIGGSWSDYLEYIEQTADGGYILGGMSASNVSGEKTEDSRGDFDYWIVKLYPDGNIQQQKTIGGAGFDRLTSIKETVDGGFMAAGTSSSNISGEKKENSRGALDYWVMKLNLCSPNISLSVTPSAVCNGESFSISVNDPGFGTNWILHADSCAGKEIARNTSGYFIVLPTATTDYFVSGEGNCIIPGSCRSITVAVNPLPTITAVASAPSICLGSPLILSASGAQTYTWDHNVISNKSFVPEATATYTVIGTDQNYCRDTTHITIPVHELPIVKALASNTEVCLGEAVALSATGAQTYIWDHGAVNDQPLAITTTTTFTVTGEDENHCTNTDQVTITINDNRTPCCDIFIPNVFTLNGDDKNPLFAPIIHDRIIDVNLEIYNRWGRKIYNDKGTDVAWGGLASDGLEAATGIYFWVLDYGCMTSENHVTRIRKKGWVQLLKD